MDCPECGSGETGVVETAPYSDRVRRRRECRACGHRFTTRESFVPDETLAQMLDQYLSRAEEALGKALDALHGARGPAGMLGGDEMLDGLREAETAIVRTRKQMKRRRKEA